MIGVDDLLDGAHLPGAVDGVKGIELGSEHRLRRLEWVEANRRVYARLQRRDPDIPTDLGWRTEATVEMVVRGRGRNEFEVAWVGEVARQGSRQSWRGNQERRFPR